MKTLSQDFESLPEFDYDPRTRVVFGSGTILRTGILAQELGGSRALVVTDHGIEKAGHAQRCVDSLLAANISSTIFSDVNPNPTTEDVDRGLEIARDLNPDVIIAIGGGSSMDCAKGVNFLYTNGGTMRDYWGVGKATKPMLPLIAIPTTAGTGSEAQSFALIADAETHMKMACGDKKAACRIAILDPDLTVSMPPSVTAATGIDAISHAVESYVTLKRNPISQLFARRAWRLLSQGFPAVLAAGMRSQSRTIDQAQPFESESPATDISNNEDVRSPWAWGFDQNDPRQPRNRVLHARGAMLLGAHLAGAAIENSMLGATHALANPLTAHFGITHGLAIGILLPHVVRFNAWSVAELYSRLAADAGLTEGESAEGPECLANWIQTVVAHSGSPTSLSQCGVSVDVLPQLAEEASHQWTATFNPRPVTKSDLLDLYRKAM